jgi:phosphohistidine phosphatase
MILYFLRHGKAYERSLKWRPDSARPLTRAGEKKMFRIARSMKEMKISFDLVLTSPYLRACRTAEILTKVYDAPKPTETDHLSANVGPAAIIKEINTQYASAEHIVLVGHEPYLSHLISTLLGGNASLAINLKKGGLCKLNVKKLAFSQCATLEWLLTPRQLAALGRD